ncbi:MAG: hypothetical protein AB7O49_19230 [Sphingomonadales bacterium]
MDSNDSGHFGPKDAPQAAPPRPALPPELLIALAAAFAIRLAVHYLAPNIIYPDEIFQTTEPAHRLAFGSGLMSWEWHVGIRSWLLPALFAALMWLGALFGDAPWLINLPVTLFMAATACIPVYCAWDWARAAHGRAAGFVAAAFCAVWIDLVYMSSHTLTEVVGAHVMVLGLYLGYPGADAAAPRRRLFWSGLLLGLTFVLRFHLAPALAVAALGICGVNRGWRPWASFLAGAALPVLLQAALDWATLGLPLQSIWLNFWLNVVVGVSDGAGVSPFATLLLMPAHIWGPIGFLLVAAAIGAAVRRLPLLLLVALTVLVVHSFVPHKEYRFIYPALALLAILAGVGSGRVIASVLAGRPFGAGARAAVAGAAALAWAALSLSIALSDVFSVPWTRGRSYLEVFEAASRDRSICAIGIYDMYWTETGGQTWLPPGVRLHASSPGLILRESAAYNALITRRDAEVADPAYRKVACFEGDRAPDGAAQRGDCLWRRPGTCDPGAAPEPGPIWDDFEAARRFLPKESLVP